MQNCKNCNRKSIRPKVEPIFTEFQIDSEPFTQISHSLNHFHTEHREKTLILTVFFILGLKLTHKKGRNLGVKCHSSSNLWVWKTPRFLTVFRFLTIHRSIKNGFRGFQGCWFRIRRRKLIFYYWKPVKTVHTGRKSGILTILDRFSVFNGE
jgi:hypothetical protein